MMNKIKEVYIGIFYWLYELGENAISKWASEWKAYMFQIVIEIWTVSSFIYYCAYLFNLKFSNTFFKYFFIIFFLFEAVKTYYLYEKDDIWKSHVSFFKNMDKKARKKTLLLTIFILLVLIVNILTSIYCLSLTKPIG